MSSPPSTPSPEHDRDEADHTFADSRPEPSAHDTTPSKRLQKEGISAAAKRRVDAVTANMENRCLITNCLPEHAVDYAHVLPRAATDTEVGSQSLFEIHHQLIWQNYSSTSWNFHGACVVER
jgi:hypothetical protein